MLRKLCVLMGLMASLAGGMSVAHAAPEVRATGGYEGCDLRSDPSEGLSKRVGFGTAPNRVKVEMSLSLSECNTHDLQVALNSGTLGTEVCALVGDAVSKLPLSLAKTARVGEMACEAVAARLRSAQSKVAAANKRSCGVLIDTFVEARLIDGQWRLAFDGVHVAGRPCPEKLKENGEPGPGADLDEIVSGGFAGPADLEMVQGRWRVLQGNVAYSGFAVDADGNAIATGTVSEGCAVVDNKQVMGIFEAQGVLRLSGCGGGDFSYARDWSLPDDYGNELHISTGAVLVRMWT